MAAKKTQGSKPFAGQMGRKPQGPQTWGMQTGSGKNKVTVTAEPMKNMTGSRNIGVQATTSGTGKKSVSRAASAVNKALKSKAAGTAGGAASKNSRVFKSPNRTDVINIVSPKKKKKK